MGVGTDALFFLLGVLCAAWNFIFRRVQVTPWCVVTPDAASADTLPGADVKEIAVIGAGPSGLVAAKHLTAAGYKVTVYEKSSSIGGTFVHKAYDDGRLVSSKYLTPFSDLRLPESAPSHQPIADYVAYLEAYAAKFDLLPLVAFEHEVLRVERLASGGHRVTTRTVPRGIRVGNPRASPNGVTSSKVFDAVCVCSGLHEVPHRPALPGDFSGELLHSSEYKDKSLFAAKRVLVVGTGETGMDLAYRAVQVAESTALSIKKGFLSVPAEGWGGLPLDTLISNLCEHAYEHRLMHKYHVKWRVTSVVIRWMFFLSTGTSGGYSQWVGTLDGEVKRGHHILCKSVAAMPYLNRPHKRRSWRRWLWWWAEPAVDKDILSYPAPSKVDGRVVTFVDGRTFEADVIVQATGYSQLSLPPQPRERRRQAAGERRREDRRTARAKRSPRQ